MKKQMVSPFQLFSLMYLFELGTAVVVSVGMTAKQDVWWVILLSTGIGILLVFLYTALYRLNHTLPLTSLITRSLGRFIGYPVAILYILFFINIAARDVRDLMELLIISILPYSSEITIGIIIMIVVSYAVYGGVEPLGRAAEIFFFLVLILGIIGTIFLMLTENALHAKRFLPLFQVHWQELITKILPVTINVPFGEGIVFTMLFPFLNQTKAVRKAGTSAILLAGLSLCFTAILEIAALGPYIASTSVFPLLSLSQQVNVLNFLQRLDPIAISVLIICVFFKITIFLYGAYIGVKDVFRIKEKGNLISILILSMIIFASSVLMASNNVQHLHIGLQIYPIYVLTPMQIVIPILLLIVAWIRKDKVSLKP